MGYNRSKYVRGMKTGIRSGPPPFRTGIGYPSGGVRYSAPEPEKPAAYEKFSASELYCPKCRQAMPVKEHLLLYLPGGEMYDYVCARCGTSVGSRKTA